MASRLTVEDYEPGVELPPVPGLRFRHLRVPDDYPLMNAVANAARSSEGMHYFTSDDDFANFYAHLSNCDPARDVYEMELGSTARIGELTAPAGVTIQSDPEQTPYRPEYEDPDRLQDPSYRDWRDDPRDREEDYLEEAPARA